MTRLIQDEEFVERWGKAYKDLRLFVRMNRFYRIWFVARRLMFVGTVFVIFDYPTF